MAGASSMVKVTFLADAKQLQDAFRSTEGQAKSWGDKMGSAGKSLTKGLTVPIVAGATLAIKAGAEEAQQMELLAAVIRKQIPDASDEMIDANEKWITSLQNTTAIADSEIRDVQQKFIAAGASIEDSQMMAAAAFDTAAATGKGYNSIADAMVKGMNGQTAGFSRLGLQVKNADGSMKSFDQILQDLSAHQGTAAEKANTSAGRFEIMKLKMADAAENIGMLLLPVLDKLTGYLSVAVDWFNDLDPAALKVVVTIAALAAAIGPVLIVTAKLVKAFQVVGTAFKVLSALMATNPWLLLIAAVVALVIIIVTNWDKISAFLKKTWEYIKKGAEVIWGAIKNFFKGVVDWLVNLFLNWTLPGLIIKHWDKIKEGVTKLRDWLFEKWNGIIDWFKRIPERIGGAVSGMWDGIKNAFRSALNWVIDKWNGFKITFPSINLPWGGKIGGFTINTPNIPRLHSGGVFRSPVPGGEGLALLRDREEVSTPAQVRSRSAAASVVNINVNAGIGTDPNAVAKKVYEALQHYERVYGPLALNVRLR